MSIADGPSGALSCWFLERTGGVKGRICKITAVALTRKSLVELCRYAEPGHDGESRDAYHATALS